MQLINDVFHRIDDINSKGYRINIEAYIRKGFRIFRAAPELFLLYTALYIVLMPIGGFLIIGPLTAGFFIAARRVDQNKFLKFDHFLDGFRVFLPLFLLTIVSGILIFIGTLALIIPGVYLSIAYSFAVFFVIYEELDFWEALEASRKLVTKEWFSIFVLIIALGLLNFLGALAFGVGVIFTIPISYAALYAAFDDIFYRN